MVACIASTLFSLFKNLPRYTLSATIHPSPSFLKLSITTMMAVTEPKTTDTTTENMAVEEPKTVETKESTESPPAESTTEKAAHKTTTLPKDESTVKTPSETPAEESSKEGEEKPKNRPSPTKQPEDHPDAKKIAVEAEGDSKDNNAEAPVDPATKDDAPVVKAETAKLDASFLSRPRLITIPASP
jgi:outer membrane biosynthesis protein TonB